MFGRVDAGYKVQGTGSGFRMQGVSEFRIFLFGSATADRFEILFFFVFCDLVLVIWFLALYVQMPSDHPLSDADRSSVLGVYGFFVYRCISRI